MSAQQKIPTNGEALIHMLAGPDHAEVILGDLEEQLHSVAKPRLRFWRQVAASSLPLLFSQIRGVPRHHWPIHLTVLCAVLFVIGAWEILVARQISWPIAKDLLSYSPLGAGNTCRAVYVLVYASFVYALLVFIAGVAKRTRRTLHFRNWHILAVAFLASVPAISLLINPLETDGAAWFRYAQIILVWTIALPMLSIRKLNMQFS